MRRMLFSVLAAALAATATAIATTGAAAQEPADTTAEAPPIGWDGQPLRWTPEQHMAFEGVQGTALSPDGSRVAYVLSTPLTEGEQSEWRTQIWVVPAAGGEPRQYTRHDSDASAPAFSPDGRWLAFGARRGGGDQVRRQVWVMPVDGGEAFPATDAEAGVGAFRWSPSGDRIAYLMTEPETEEEKAREREKRDVIYVDRDFDFAHLYWVPFDPGAGELPDATRVTEGDVHLTAFDWSPDGARFVVAHQPDPRLDTGSEAADLATVPASGGELRPLVTLGGVDASPRWSPDGRWVAFIGEGAQPEPVGLGDVYVVPADGGEPRRLAETPDRSPNLLGWSGDARTLYVLESLGVDRHVLAVPVDGGPVRQVTAGAGVVGSPSLDPSATRLAFTWEDPDTPWDVYVRPVEGATDRRPTRLTRLHDHVDVPPMGRTEKLTWPSQDGRFEIEGLLTYPVGYRPGTRVPLILSVHGGPAGVYSRSFTGGPGIYMTQYFADHGWAVLRPNPRGSTGYGKEFRYANVRDWGFGDMDDLMAGVDHVIEMGVAHPDSLLLMGWSYGGYMTSFAVTRTHRFRAASMGAGLPNLVSMVTTTDVGNYLAGHMDAEFWDDYDVYERHSAIYRIAEVETPTQVIHGAQDLRVPFTQGQEFYRALLRRGVPTEMIVLPRTPHGPREPKLLMAVSPAIQTWFARWLREDR
jgi:dipeptidyl aminopeptidase/acylaminoacyl peptidase